MIAIRKHAKEFLAILGLIAVAAGVSLYLLDKLLAGRGGNG